MEQLEYIDTEGAKRAVQLATYPDSAPLVKEWGTVEVKTVLLRPASFASFVAAMFWLDSIAERHGWRPHLILPFVPGARQDRLNTEGDALFTAKSVAKMINARNLPSVTVLDPHSEVTPALIDSCRVVTAADCINPPAGKYAAVVAPDAGAEKRAMGVAKKLGVPLVHAWKRRELSTGAISGFGHEPMALQGRSRLLLVDDICDGGRTFTGLADVIGIGFDLHLYVTHGLFTQGMSALSACFSHIYATDSVATGREGVIQIDVCEKLLRGAP